MKGWECPKCGAVYAPGVPACETCGPIACISLPVNCTASDFKIGGAPASVVAVRRRGDRVDIFAELAAADVKRSSEASLRAKYGLDPQVRYP